jgi:hypothetical protein
VFLILDAGLSEWF